MGIIRMVRAVPLAFLALIVLMVLPVNASPGMQVTIYASLSCPQCKVYLDDLIPSLKDAGYTDITVKDWSADINVVSELQALHEEMAVPKSMRGKVTTVVDGRFLFEGFVPAENITRFLSGEAKDYRRFVLYMSPEDDTYKIVNDLGQVVECPVTEPLSSCDAERFRLVPPGEAMLPLVIGAGLLNGFNPCSISVLLFLVSMLFSSGRTRGQVLKAGAIYLTSIFLVYVFAGLGILHAIGSLPSSLFLSKVGGVILIALGAVNVKDFFWFGRGFSLQMPRSQMPRVADWASKATLPAAVVLGLLIGLLTFPCMGGVYLAIIGMLTLRPTYLEALGYLVTYNVATILPSMVLLYLASRRILIEKLQGWRESKKKWMKLAAGLTMIVLGLIILII